MPFSSVLGASSVIRPGVCTSTTRPTVPYEGQLIYETDTDRVASWDGSAWVYTHSSGLVLVKSQTIGSAVSSVEVTDVFSSTYDNYKIQAVGGTSSANANLLLQLGATTTGYYAGYSRVIYSSGTTSLIGDNNTANWTRAGATNTNGMGMNVDLLGPNLAKNTIFHGIYADPATGSNGGGFGGFLNNTTAYTAFTILPSTGTLTGGTIRVYGYKN